jgi:hypothetical protein
MQVSHVIVINAIKLLIDEAAMTLPLTKIFTMFEHVCQYCLVLNNMKFYYFLCKMIKERIFVSSCNKKALYICVHCCVYIKFCVTILVLVKVLWNYTRTKISYCRKTIFKSRDICAYITIVQRVKIESFSSSGEACYTRNLLGYDITTATMQWKKNIIPKTVSCRQQQCITIWTAWIWFLKVRKLVCIGFIGYVGLIYQFSLRDTVLYGNVW